MLTLVVATAAVLAVILVGGLVAVLIFVTEIRRFVAEAAMTLEATGNRASRLAAHLQRVQQSTATAASELSPGDA